MNAQNPRAFVEVVAAAPASPVDDHGLLYLAASWRAVTAEINACPHDSGPVLDSLSERQEGIERQLRGYRASTVDGLRAKAEVLESILGDLDDREALALSLVNDILRVSSTPDPVFIAIALCRKTYEAWGEVLKSDPDGDKPASALAMLGFMDAWEAACSRGPCTIEGMRAFARYALEISELQGAYDYHEDALRVLAAFTVPELVAAAQKAEVEFVAASEAAEGHEGNPEAVEHVRLKTALEREAAAFRAAVTARPTYAADVDLVIGLIKRRSNGSMLSPSEGLFTLLDHLRSFIAGEGALSVIAPLAGAEANLRENVRLREEFDRSNSDHDDPHYDRHWQLREEIDALPACCLADLNAKVFAAYEAARHDADLSNEGPGSFVGLAQSIMSDICRLTGKPDLFATRYPIREAQAA